ncbi:hypothetical protein PNI0008_02353 [Streptococcus pneumoniae PNI0008]|nr:hypothetical protein PCS70012_00324 [Streptococcus pneumoniae PCS70012]ELU66146.1 hypothetical protein PNI0002_00590 [Streptococcus pneumoniae PNI0002]ELU67004.1 hypothetical protein PNI0006_01622 [Streptococcus pneumoniae PNI0006]ELU69170.1 hypothetical protein PNI0008_02353 [Streptococcus pneumoniae PNI0008]ELU75434.1 hypothetical protein PNI0007_00172 [Streptococcus pneumoniae PNI0007]ELU77004.1 hypothetical protein PNI0010_01078 [Streptococcus pneumoniae PNI0010]ELU79629.1 hypothetical
MLEFPYSLGTDDKNRVGIASLSPYLFCLAVSSDSSRSNELV